MKTSFSTVVIGCNKHIQIAQRCFLLLEKFWPSVLKKAVFATDGNVDIKKPFFENIVIDSTGSYGNRIIKTLECVDSEYVLLLLDDYFITADINEQCFDTLVENLKKNHILYCKLIGMPKMHRRYKNILNTFIIQKDTYYGVSLQPSIWQKDALLNFLRDRNVDTAWKVEADLSEFQKEHFSQCISFNKNLLNYKNGVLRGKLFPYTNKILTKYSIEKLGLQEISYISYIKFRAKQKIAGIIPKKFRIFLKTLGRKHGKQYFSNN